MFQPLCQMLETQRASYSSTLAGVPSYSWLLYSVVSAMTEACKDTKEQRKSVS